MRDLGKPGTRSSTRDKASHRRMVAGALREIADQFKQGAHLRSLSDDYDLVDQYVRMTNFIAERLERLSVGLPVRPAPSNWDRPATPSKGGPS